MNTTQLHPKFLTHPYEVIETQLQLHKYSDQTIKAYLGQLKNFFCFVLPRKPHKVSDLDLKEYLKSLSDSIKSRSTIDQAVNALRFLWQEIFQQRFPIEDVQRPSKKERKPVFLTLEEVRKIALGAENLKHRLMIELAYSAGLRVSEVVNTRVKDVDMEQKKLFVCGTGKNPKGRATIFSRSLEDALMRQIGMKQPDDYLFPSERGGKLTTRAFSKYFKAALEASGIKKEATPHSLRHSFAAYMLQAGAKVRTVQNLLGHVRRESTIFYTKLADENSVTIPRPY